MTTTMETTPVLSPGEQVAAKTICLALKIGTFGNTRQASLAPVTVEADKTLLRLTKTLLDSPELVTINKGDRALTAAIRKLAFKSYFKGGVYLLPLATVEQVEGLIAARMQVRATEIDIAVQMYEQRCAETSERLGTVADGRDYPSVERFRQTFYMEHNYITFETPSRLKAISAALFAQEAEKQRAKLESVADACQQTMRAGLLQLVEHLTDRLTPDAEGKPKRLHTTTITHLTDFLDTFALRNVTDDTELGALVEKAQAIMKGIDHKTLKSDDLIRQKIVADLSSVQASLAPMVVAHGSRQIDLDDE